MVKFKCMLGIAVIAVATTVNAQSIFNPQTKTAPGVMSPEDFGKRVNTLGKQTQDQLKQQVNSELQKPNPPSLGTPPASTAPAANQNQQQAPAQNNPTANPAAKPDDNKIDPNIPANSALQPQSQQPAAQADQNAASAGSPSSVYTPPADSTQSGPYTGFGGGNTNNKPTAGQQPPSNTSSGLNIHY